MTPWNWFQLQYIHWRTRKWSKPDLIDRSGFPHWLWENGSVEEESMHWRFTDGLNTSANVRFVWSAEDDYLTLGDIVVESEYWGRGIGSHLIERLKYYSVELGKQGIVGEISELDINGGQEHPPQPHLMDWYRRRGFEVTEYDQKRGVMLAEICWER